MEPAFRMCCLLQEASRFHIAKVRWSLSSIRRDAIFALQTEGLRLMFWRCDDTKGNARRADVFCIQDEVGLRSHSRRLAGWHVGPHKLPSSMDNGATDAPVNG